MASMLSHESWHPLTYSVCRATLHASFVLQVMSSADQDKVQALMESIQDIGLKEPVSVSVRQPCWKHF